MVSLSITLLAFPVTFDFKGFISIFTHVFVVQSPSFKCGRTVPVGKTHFFHSYIYIIMLVWVYVHQELLPLGKTSMKNRDVSSLKQNTQGHSQVLGNDASVDLQ